MAFPFDFQGQTVYSSDFAPPIVDHLHERATPHPPILQYLIPHLRKLTHHFQPPAVIPQEPDLDIRDTGPEYIIDVELAGVKDKDAIKIEWTSSRSLLISGNIERPVVVQVQDDTPAPALVTGTAEKVKPTETPAPKTNGVAASDKGNTQSQSPPPSPLPLLVVAERKIGPFRRHFTFPVDVDLDKLKARLDSGLLQIRVPKKAVWNVENTGRLANIEWAI